MFFSRVQGGLRWIRTADDLGHWDREMDGWTEWHQMNDMMTTHRYISHSRGEWWRQTRARKPEIELYVLRISFSQFINDPKSASAFTLAFELIQ